MLKAELSQHIDIKLACVFSVATVKSATLYIKSCSVDKGGSKILEAKVGYISPFLLLKIVVASYP